MRRRSSLSNVGFMLILSVAGAPAAPADEPNPSVAFHRLEVKEFTALANEAARRGDIAFLSGAAHGHLNHIVGTASHGEDNLRALIDALGLVDAKSDAASRAVAVLLRLSGNPFERWSPYNRVHLMRAFSRLGYHGFAATEGLRFINEMDPYANRVAAELAEALQMVREHGNPAERAALTNESLSRLRDRVGREATDTIWHRLASPA